MTGRKVGWCVMAPEIVVGIIAGIAGVIGASIGLLGKRDETAQSATEALINGQATRIDRLETRQDTVEAALRETRQELHDTRNELNEIQSHAGDLRDALRRALIWIGEVLEHLASPDTIAPPPAPDVETWQSLIDSPPRARNPPT